MNMQSAGFRIIGAIAKGGSGSEQFIPCKMMQMKVECHRVRYDFQAVMQAAVCFDVYVFGIRIHSVQQNLCISVRMSTVIDFRFHSEISRDHPIKARLWLIIMRINILKPLCIAAVTVYIALLTVCILHAQTEYADCHIAACKQDL